MNNNIKICKECLYPSTHPLGITFDESGLCSGCQIHKEKNQLDWKFRLQKLKKIIKNYRSRNGNYDCVIPVTGAGDSHFIVHVAKNLLKLNPLLVCHNKYFNTEIGIKNLANLRIKFDCDAIIQNINLDVIKKITRYSFLEYGNIYWPVISGNTSFPVQIASKYKIPLILWGAHQGLEQVGMFSHLNEVEMSRRYREDHDLFGKDEFSFLSVDNDIKEEDILQFIYPDRKTINSIGIRGLYLGNFIRWDSVAQHKLMVNKFGYLATKLNRTFDTYNHTDCFNYTNLHDFLKLCKHGYSKVLDDVCREIRYKRITREQGLHLVKLYENKKIQNLDLFCEWIGVSKKSLSFVIDRFKNRNFWKQVDVDKWTFNGVSKRLNKKKIINNNFEIKNFKKNFLIKKNVNREYIYFGKGVES
jgi:N-acetyl sugar amidotransferase|tara:strand:- start:290 stop:1534 length:1245 start_codon:yes stop_codon:yes gene_type:complete